MTFQRLVNAPIYNYKLKNDKSMSSCFGCLSKRKNVNANGKFKKPYYCIKSVKAGRVMNINQESKENQIVIMDENKEDNQRFIIKQKGPDFFFKCKKNRLYLTVDGPQNGAQVYATSKNMGENQRFRLEEVGTNPETGGKKYVIYTFFGKVLDVFEGKRENGSIITQYDYIGKDHQHWELCDPSDASSSSSSTEDNK